MAPASFPKSHNLPGGLGTALKPAHEPIVVARKPLVGTVAQNVERFGTGALNIDGCRIESDGSHKRGFVDAAPGRNVYGDRPRLQEGFQATDADGRWPANVVLDEAAAAELDRQSGELKGAVSNGRLGVQGVYEDGIGASAQVPTFGDTGGASRFFYVAKSSRSERTAGVGVNAHPT